MSDIAISENTPLPALIDRAAAALSSAKSSAEVLEARDMARIAYDAAKSAGRMARAKKAHEEVIAAVYRAQADALLIEARAKSRLADEYDAAQDRGEVARLGDNLPSVDNSNSKPTAADLGLRRDEIHEARQIRDAEEEDPGIMARTLSEIVERGEEPTKAKLKASIKPSAHESPPPKNSNEEDELRKEARKLTRDALEEDWVELRISIKRARKEKTRLEGEVKALKESVANLSATEKGEVIRRLEREKANINNARWKAAEERDRYHSKARALGKELDALRAAGVVHL